MEGTKLGSYQVDSELGSGGMGTVYLATVVDDAPGDTACKVPLALEYIEKMEKAGRVGKKRKTTRC